MKKLLLFIAVINLFQVKSQSAQFAWIKGSSANYQYGVYGTQGVSNATNLPGFRSDHVSWTNNTGTLWMFGGTGYAVSGAAGQLNDLWKYNVSLNEWTWIKGPSTINQIGAYGTKGISSATTTPGSRYSSATWIDNSGNLWLFGGNGRATTATAGYLNDLWKYDITTNEWTWISGSNAINQVGTYGTKGVPTASTTPGGRYDAVTWVDNSGNLWMHGGNGLAVTASGGLLNDLWKFDVLTNQWTWISGSNAINQTCTYGTKGISGPSNLPGGRSSAGGFKDNNGDFWLFGGNGIPGTATVGMLCDLWKYSFSNNQWTWVSGTNFGGSVGIYGSKGFPAASNYPGGRMDATTWVDSQNNFWLYGGYGAGSVAGNGALNDLWMYNTLNNTWVWTSGANTIGQSAVYGTQGVSSATNTPGGRYKSCSWTDNAGAFWLYGGTVVGGERSDLWKMDVCIAPLSPSAASQTICVGSSGTLTATGTANLSWYSGATGGTYLASGNLYVTPTLTSNTTYYVQDSTCAQSLRTPVVVAVTQPTITIAGTNTVCVNSTAILTASGATSYTWSTSQITNTVAVSPSVTTIYTVTGANAFGCLSTKTKTLTTVALPSVTITGATTICPSTGIFLTASGANSYTWNTGSTSASIMASPASSFVYTVTGRTTSTGCVNTQTALVTVSIPTLVIAGLTSVCKNTPVVLTTSGANTYTWSTGTQATSISVAPTATTVYTVTGKDSFGCNGTDTHTINVIPSPTVSVFTPGTLCAGTAFTLNASGATTYTWMPGNISGSPAIVTPTASMTYSVIGTAANTCTGSTTVFLTVDALPNINIVTSTTVVCAGTPIILNGSGGSVNGYTWSTGATTFSTTVTPTATVTYTLIGTGPSSCTNTAVKTITVNALPVLTISGNSTICNGSSAIIDVSGANTYTWSNTSTSPTITITPSITTTYSVIGKDLNNCTNTAVQTVTVNPLPILNVSSTNTMLCTGETATLSVLGASSYTWSDNSNGTDLVVSPSSNTNYTVTGIDANNCSNSSVFTQSVSVCTGIHEAYSNSNSVVVFPNPSNGVFTIQSEMADAISITNELGQVIEVFELNQQNNYSYRVEHLQSGIYFLVGKTIKQKVIVSK